MSDLVYRLSVVADEYFDSTVGEPRAFMLLPQRDGDDIMLVYVTYGFRGPDLAKLEQAMIDEVLHPLGELAGDDARLWWRLPHRFEVTLDSDGENYLLRTRVAVLDEHLNVVRLNTMAHAEGEPHRMAS